MVWFRFVKAMQWRGALWRNRKVLFILLIIRGIGARKKTRELSEVHTRTSFCPPGRIPTSYM